MKKKKSKKLTLKDFKNLKGGRMVQDETSGSESSGYETSDMGGVRQKAGKTGAGKSGSAS